MPRLNGVTPTSTLPHPLCGGAGELARAPVGTSGGLVASGPGLAAEQLAVALPTATLPDGGSTPAASQATSDSLPAT